MMTMMIVPTGDGSSSRAVIQDVLDRSTWQTGARCPKDHSPHPHVPMLTSFFLFFSLAYICSLSLSFLRCYRAFVHCAKEIFVHFIYDPLLSPLLFQERRRGS